MGAQLYLKGKEHILGGEVDLLNGEITVLLINSLYVPNLSTHESRESIPDDSIVSEATLENASITNGIFDADDLTFNDVDGDPVYSVVLFYEGITYAQSWLLAAYYASNSTPLFTPDGTDITIQWDIGVNKIFSI